VSARAAARSGCALLELPSRWNAFIDLDRVLKSPAHPSWLRVAYDSRDHLHPNDAGHAAIARSIELSLL